MKKEHFLLIEEYCSYSRGENVVLVKCENPYKEFLSLQSYLKDLKVMFLCQLHDDKLKIALYDSCVIFQMFSQPDTIYNYKIFIGRPKNENEDIISAPEECGQD